MRRKVLTGIEQNDQNRIKLNQKVDISAAQPAVKLINLFF